MKIIETKNLDFFYGDNHALKKINLQIEAKKVTALIGPSGCGKSTFLKTVNRMNDIIEGTIVDGEVLFNGIDIYSKEIDPMEVRKKIGMVFQKANPFPMSIYENIVYAPKYHGIHKSKLDEIVEKSLKSAALWEEVKDRLKKPALSLSGGQQQRLCIARSIAMEPEIILMDEATSALDPISTFKIEELMNTLKEKFTVVIVTHNMQQAIRIADETAFFLNGEMLEFGETDQIFTSPIHKKTHEYVTGRFG